MSDTNTQALQTLSGWRAHARDGLQEVKPLFVAAAECSTNKGNVAWNLWIAASQDCERGLQMLSNASTDHDAAADWLYRVWAFAEAAKDRPECSPSARALFGSIHRTLNAATDKVDEAKDDDCLRGAA